MDLQALKLTVAQNIYYLRTKNHMTQYELGQKLSYSDKAISKWERGDGLPDAYVLLKISELFGVTLDYLVSEHSEQDNKIETKPIKKAKRIIANIVFFGIITLAVLLFVILWLSVGKCFWQIFIYMLPIISIVSIVFSSVWEKGRGVFLCSSVLIWSLLTSFFIGFLSKGVFWQVFLIGIPLQIIVFLCFRIKITITFTQKDKKTKQVKKPTQGE